MKSFALRSQRRTTVPLTTPAPYKGLNSVDSLAAMDPAFGLQIDNFIATPQGLAMRGGYRTWVTGFTGKPTSFLTYNSTSPAANKFFCVVGSNIYDITSSGTVGSPVVSGLNASAPYWQSTSQTFSTAGTNYLMAVNGSDSPLLFNGISWTTCTQTASPAAPGQWKDVDANGNPVDIRNFVDILLHQQRLWFVPINSTKAFYGDVASVGGTLTPLDFGPLFPRGGTLHKLATWTMDLGSLAGTQSLLVAISSKGDVVVFQGTNPAVSTSWAMTAQYQLGSPIGRRSVVTYQGDLMVLSQDGLYPLSRYIQSARLDSSAALSYAISTTISDLVSRFSATPGFELLVAAKQNLLILNVPQLDTSQNIQYVFHTISKAWTRFTGWGANCFGIFNDDVYFGGDGYVAYCFQGYKDGASMLDQGGTPITATALTAFTVLGNIQGLGGGSIKHVKAVKPYITTDVSNPTVKVGVNTDYNTIAIVGTASASVPSGGVFDQAKWDDISALWANSSLTYNQWATVLCYPGDALALAISISASGNTMWTSTSWLIDKGGQFG